MKMVCESFIELSINTITRYFAQEKFFMIFPHQTPQKTTPKIGGKVTQDGIARFSFFVVLAAASMGDYRGKCDPTSET